MGSEMCIRDSDYTVGEFLSRGLRQLISIALSRVSLLEIESYSPLSVGQFHFTLPKKVAEQTFGLNWPTPPAGKAPGNNFINADEFLNATKGVVLEGG